MNEASEVQIARMAVDMTIALMNDRSGHLRSLMAEAKIPSGSSPMAIFDEVHAHLLRALSRPTD